MSPQPCHRIPGQRIGDLVRSGVVEFDTRAVGPALTSSEVELGDTRADTRAGRGGSGGGKGGDAGEVVVITACDRTAPLRVPAE
ncbi:MAG: hypothetical protein ACRDTF_11650 [Pseudonocardiaceae bacterium]